MRAERAASESGDFTEVEKIKAEMLALEQGVTPAPAKPAEPVDAHTAKLQNDLEAIQKLHVTKDKEIEELKDKLAKRQEELKNLPVLKAQIKELNSISEGLEEILEKLTEEKDEKLNIQQAAQNPDHLKVILAGHEREQADVNNAIDRLLEEKKRRLEELKATRTERKAASRLRKECDDLSARVHEARERVLQLMDEKHELSGQLDDIIQQNQVNISNSLQYDKQKEAEYEVHTEKVSEMNTLYQQVLEFRKNVYPNSKPVNFSWPRPAVLCGDFPHEVFDVEHVLQANVSSLDWGTTLYLPAGKYHYKFKENGAWKVDESLPREGDTNVITVS